MVFLPTIRNRVEETLKTIGDHEIWNSTFGLWLDKIFFQGCHDGGGNKKMGKYGQRKKRRRKNGKTTIL